MCGIAGYATRRGPLPDGLLESMRDTLAHRGPDGAGVWVRADRRLGLAHRRLAVIDLSEAAAQPMLSPEGDLVLTFNGEIYNHAELRVELARKGLRFRTSSDTEVLLQAYRAWGTDCLERLGGMFAFALYDAGARRLFLARDRAGEKPLFYRGDAHTFAFASELKALLLDGSSRTIDPEALEAYLAYGYVPGERCILVGARKLPPAHALEYDVETGALRAWRYWDVPGGPEPGGRAAAAAGALLEEAEVRLQAAVRRQLVADVPLGVLLSGGLDSSLVTAMAAHASAAPVKTFTVTFPGHGSYDEAAYARLVASHFGTAHTELPAQELTPELLPLLARQCDEPIADSSLVPTYLVSRLMRAHVTVALGGDGGDELFAGYPHYSWVQRQAQLRRVVPAGVRTVVASIGRRLPVGTRGRNHLIGVAGDTGRSLAHVNVYFDAATRRRLLRRLPATALGAAPEAERTAAGSGGLTPLQRMTRMDFRQYLADDLLVKVDRASMLSALEVRAPFLDRELVEFAFSRLPDPLLATPSERKVLLRRLAARHLPPALDLRRKQGFSIPLARWVRGRWGDALREVLASAAQPLFDPAVVAELADRPERRSRNAQRLYALAFFELWRREYGAELPL